MSFSVFESDVVLLIMQYLRDRGAYEALTALALESDLGIGIMGNDMRFLQKLVLQGRWSDVTSLLNPVVQSINEAARQKITFHITRQKFLESMSWQGGGGERFAFPPFQPSSAAGNGAATAAQQGDVGSGGGLDATLALLNSLQPLCSVAEFSSLCSCLTLERLDQHPDLQSWTVAEGRYRCFAELRNLLHSVMPEQNEPEPPSNQDNVSNIGLLKVIAMSLEHQRNMHSSRSFAQTETAHLHPITEFFVSESLSNRSVSNLSSLPVPIVLKESSFQFLKRFDQNKPVVARMNVAAGGLSSVSKPNPSPSASNTTGGLYSNPPSSSRPQQQYQQQQQQQPQQQQQMPAFSPRPESVFPSAPSSSRAVSGRGINGGRTAGGVYVGEPGTTIDNIQPPQALPRASYGSAMAVAAAAGEYNYNNSNPHGDGRLPTPVSARSGNSNGIHQHQHQQQPVVIPAKPRQAPVAWVVGADEQPEPSNAAAAGGGGDYKAQQQQEDSRHNYNKPVVVGAEVDLDMMPANLRRKLIAQNESNAEAERLANAAAAANTVRTGSARSGSAQRARSGSAPRTGGGTATAAATGARGRNGGTSGGAYYEGSDDESRVSAGTRATVSSAGSTATGGTRGSLSTAGTVQTGATTFRQQGQHLQKQTIQQHQQQQQQQQQQPAPLEFYTIFQTGCPMRCAVPMHAHPSLSSSSSSSALNNGGVAMSYIALGTNAKSINVVKYGTSCDSLSDSWNSNNIAQVMKGADGSVIEPKIKVTSPPSAVQLFDNVHKGSVYAMDWLPGEAPGLGLLVTGSNDKSLRVTSTSNSLLSGSFKGHTGTVRAVRFQPDELDPSLVNPSAPLLVASGGAGDFCPRLFNVSSEQCVRVLESHKATIYGLAWTSHNTFVTACQAGQITSHDIRAKQSTMWSLNINGNDVPVDNASNERRGITCLSYSSSTTSSTGGQLVVGCNNGSVLLFDEGVRAIMGDWQLHKDEISSVTLGPKVSDNNSSSSTDMSYQLLTSSYDHSAALWSLRPSQTRGGEISVQMTQRLAGAHADKVLCAVPVHVSMTSAATATSQRRAGTSNSSSSSNKGVASSPLSNKWREIITTGADGKAVLWTL